MRINQSNKATMVRFSQPSLQVSRRLLFVIDTTLDVFTNSLSDVCIPENLPCFFPS